LKNKRILITGGTGSLGTALTKVLAKDNELLIYSRDEQKHALLPSTVQSFIGDVRDYERLKMACYGVDLIIHCAAMKHVEICEREPFECVATNVNGAKNVIRAAIEEKVPKVVALSTDKACNPINLYGATKLVSDKLFLNANNYGRKIQEKGIGPFGYADTQQFCVCRYGNVMGSKGSVIPKWVELARKGEPLPITHPDMTRFMMKMSDAVDMVLHAKKGMNIAKAPSMKMYDVAETIAEKYNEIDYQFYYEEVGIRPGEKMHEQLDTDYYSNTNKDWMTPDDLREWLDANYGK